ncbi:MAG: D-alanine--D-alanine ligase [Candidatus Omnitrophota bacterium]
MAVSYGKIGVLMGGLSSEREISLKSGKAVLEALEASGVEAVAIDIKTEDKEENIRLIRSRKITCAFIALHGRFGEDGQIQEILEAIKLPYTGSGVKASRLGMDKIASKKIFAHAKLHVPDFIELDKHSYTPDFSADGLRWPLVVKPAAHGSSIGLSIIDKREDLAGALEIAFNYDDKAVIEEYIQGREMTVGILGQRALPVIEVVPKKRFFDYDCKYKQGLTEYIVPARIEVKLAKKLQQAAKQAHKLLDCFGCSRVDLILSKDNLAYVLELNSIPGFTSTSLLPKAARQEGIEFPQLCLKLIEFAYAKK